MTAEISDKSQSPPSFHTLQVQRASQACRVKMLLVGRRAVKCAGVILSRQET